MQGTYLGNKGRQQKVAGDINKLHLVPKLSKIAKSMLARVRAMTRKIPGTNEVCTLMRYDTHAARISQGTPIFLILSPDEKHNLILIRMCRTRKKDPANLGDAVASQWGERLKPSLHADADIVKKMSPEELAQIVPDFDCRRRMISRDALASVDGFRTYIFFLSICLGCAFVQIALIAIALTSLGVVLSLREECWVAWIWSNRGSEISRQFTCPFSSFCAMHSPTYAIADNCFAIRAKFAKPERRLQVL